MRVSFLRLSAGALLFLLANAMLIPAYALCLGPTRVWRRPIQIMWCRVVCRLAGLRVHIAGTPHMTGPTLYVSNHVSYLDIAVLSRYLEGVYVAKSEVAQWPLFGTIARLTGSIFVSRRSRDARVQREKVRAHLAKSGSLLLFPEGTSTDGTGVAPFKAALFDIAGIHGSEISVQPISLAYTCAIDGTPLTGPHRKLYAWYADMTLLPHLLRVLGLPGAKVELCYHSAVQPSQFASRKALARYCEEQVAAGVANAHRKVSRRLKVAAE